MNLNQLSAFREVMRTGSASEAARHLNRTQPSISHMIKSLEQDLGIALFERRGGRLHPTPEAQYLFAEGEELLRRLEAIDRNMKRIKTLARGELRIASMPGPSVALLPELLADFIPPGSEVVTTLLSRSSDAVLQLMSAQQLDLGVADYDLTAPLDSSLISSEVFLFDMLCALPAEDPLARRDVVTPSDLDGRPLATLLEEHPSHSVTIRAFQAAGRRADVRYLAQYFLPLMIYVERGRACAIVDPLTAEIWRRRGPSGSGSVAFRPFEPRLRFGVVVLTPTYRPPSLLSKAFRQHLVEELRRLGGVALPGS